MTTVYYIFLISFLGFPVLGLILSKYLKINWSSKLNKLTILFFVSHNLLFFFGFSLKGDYVDYSIFSIEYLIFCLTVCLLFKSTNIYIKVFRVLGAIIISLGFIFGLFGILFFIFMSMDYEADKIFHFNADNENYETRRYSFGGATLSDTRYIFETYRDFKYLPIEYKLDRTDFFGSKTDLDISEPGLKINILKNGKAEEIIFKSTNGKTFLKSIN